MLGISLSAGRVHALCYSEDVVQVGRIPDVIFPAGRASCIEISPGLMKIYGITPNALDSNCGSNARVLSGYPHVKIWGGEYASDETFEANPKVGWALSYLQLCSDGTPGSGTIELYAYDNGSGDQVNVDTPRNLNNYPFGYFSYFVTNDITDNAFTQTATASNIVSHGNSTTINNPAINARPGMALNVTPVWNYGSAGGVYNNHPIAAIYGYDSPGYWSIVNSDGGAMLVGAAFNVEFVPSSVDNSFTTGACSNCAESANLNTQVYSFGLSPPITARTIMDFNYGALLFPTSLDGRDPHPNSVHFESPTTWTIANADLYSMVISSFSAMMIGWADPGAYIFNQSGGTGVVGASMYFQRFSGSGYADPVALTHIFVAPQVAASNYLPSPLGVWWDGTEWVAFREDLQAMPTSASINVYAHRPAFIASPVKGDTNGDRLADFVVVGGPTNPIIEAGLAQSGGGFAPLISGDGNSIDQDFTTSWAQSSNVKVLSGDFDGDGRTDLALTGVSGWSTIPLALANGDGGYRVTNHGVTMFEPDYDPSSQDPPAMPAPWTAMSTIPNYDPNFTTYASWAGVVPVAGDFNGDGITDIAVTGGPILYTVPVAFSRGDSEGTFVATNAGITGGDTGFPSYTRVAGVKVLAGDFDGDGRTDIAVVGGSGWWTTPFAKSNGDGTFYCYNYAWSGSSAFAAYATTAQFAVVGDFNGDHKSDIALFSSIGTIEIAFSNGDGTFHSTSFANPLSNLPAGSHSKVVAGDYNGDGYTDLLIFADDEVQSAAIGELISQGNGNFTGSIASGKTGLSYFAGAPDARVVGGSY